MGLGLRRPSAIVDLKRVEALGRIEVDADGRTVTVGAAATHRRLSDDLGVREHLPTLAGAASRVGNARVRSTGTVGGNLCFAEPRSDLGCVLVALGASAEVRSVRGARTLTIDELIVGAFETSLAEDEILTTVTVPFEPPGMSYWKLRATSGPPWAWLWWSATCSGRSLWVRPPNAPPASCSPRATQPGWPPSWTGWNSATT